MAWLNIVGIIIIFFMSKPTMAALKDYEDQQKQGVTEFTFNPVKLGIKGRRTGKGNTFAKRQSPTAEVKETQRVEQTSSL